MATIHASEGATALVGLASFAVGVQALIDGEHWLDVETRADVVGCPECGVRADGHGRQRFLVRDLPIAGTPTVLVWAKRRWRRPELGCETVPDLRRPRRSGRGRR